MRKIFFLFLVGMMMGCQTVKTQQKISNENGSVYYEIFVGSFYDSNQDGIGDLQGIIHQLPYLESLGIKGVWLTPIHPSPTYHKYDVMDYRDIDPQFGSMSDFDQLVSEAKEKNIDLLLDLVINHTSDQHPWFIEAKKNQLNGTCDQEDSKCDYYNFTETKQNHSEKIQDNLYYEASFTGNMPDLNLDNPKVRDEIYSIVKFWMEKGIKGFRLDASLHYYGSTGPNVEFLSWLNDKVKQLNPDSFVVAEVWTDEVMIQNHYESQLDSFFNFTASSTDGKIVKAIRNQNGASLARWMMDYNQEIKAINPTAIDTVFLSNHDQGRSGAYFGNDIEKTKLMASILLLSSGRPFIYYGEEIGMFGSGDDPNKRLPMVWGEDEGMCQNPPGVNYNSKFSSSVKDQSQKEGSLLEHYRQVISIRNQYPVFEWGKNDAIDLSNEALYAMVHQEEGLQVLVVHNLSSDPQLFEVESSILKMHSIGEVKQSEATIELAPYASVVLELEGDK